jgi:type VI secretion system secreted protein Hcp
MKDIYIDFGQGEIQGDVRDEKFKTKKAIEVHSWTHAIVQPKSATSSTSGGHTSERVEHGEMIFTKDIDKASPQIWMAASAGTIYKEVIVSFFRAVGGSNSTSSTSNARVEYLKITLRNVLIAHVNSSVGAAGLPSEEIGLKYSAVKWEYREAKLDGTSNSSMDRIGQWDLATNLPKY